MSDNSWNRFKNKINNFIERVKEIHKEFEQKKFENWQFMICTPCSGRGRGLFNKCKICDTGYSCESCRELNKIHLGFQMCQKCRIYNTENNKKVMISIRDARRGDESRPSLHGLLIRPHSYVSNTIRIDVPLTRIVCDKELREEIKSKECYINFD